MRRTLNPNGNAQQSRPAKAAPAGNMTGIRFTAWDLALAEVALVVIVMVETPFWPGPMLSMSGLKVQTVSAGKPEQVKLTEALRFALAVMVTPKVPVWPLMMVRSGALSEKE
jgi:hypothetical protein